jgi:hypothetical protein
MLDTRKRSRERRSSRSFPVSRHNTAWILDQSGVPTRRVGGALVTRRCKSQPKSADRGADAQPSARYRTMAKESFDLADVVGASRLRELERDAFPARYFFAQLSPGVHITSVWHPHTRKHDTGLFHPFRRHAPAAPSTCTLGTWANEQQTCEPRLTHRCRRKTFEALQLCPRTTRGSVRHIYRTGKR